MKKALLFSLCLTVGSCQANITKPVPTTAAVFGTAAITATSWGAVKILGSYAAKGSLSLAKAFSQKSLGTWPTLAASLVAAGAAWCGWKFLSRYTASGYARAAHHIMSGATCSCPEVVEFVHRAAGDPQVLTDLVVQHFVTGQARPDKATDALTEWSNQLHVARGYLVIAQKGGNLADNAMIISIDGYINLIESAQPMVNAHSHVRAAQDIMMGKRLGHWCYTSLEQIYEMVKQSNSNAQLLSDFVVRYYATSDDGYLKAVATLVALNEKFQLAADYFEIAKKTPAFIDIEKVKRDQKIVSEWLTVIQSSLLILKAHPCYMHQQEIKRIEAAESAARAAESAAHSAAIAAHEAAAQARVTQLQIQTNHYCHRRRN